MTREVTDPIEREALLWELVRRMIHRHGPNWQTHLKSVWCDDVAELLAPLGTAKDWVCRALDEIDEARHTGDWEVVADRTYVLGRIIMSGEVTVP